LWSGRQYLASAIIYVFYDCFHTAALFFRWAQTETPFSRDEKADLAAEMPMESGERAIASREMTHSQMFEFMPGKVCGASGDVRGAPTASKGAMPAQHGGPDCVE
jgi:hypothetical protein